MNALEQHVAYREIVPTAVAAGGGAAGRKKGALNGLHAASAVSGVVRQKLLQATEERLVQGLQGYLTSWAALGRGEHLPSALEAVRPVLQLYLESRGRTFAGEVQRKRSRLMSVTAFLDPPSPVDEEVRVAGC